MTFPKWFLLIVLICLCLLTVAGAVWFKPGPVTTISITADTAVTVQGNADFQNYPVVRPEPIKIKIPEVGK
jgi:hypothetical protein